VRGKENKEIEKEKSKLKIQRDVILRELRKALVWQLHKWGNKRLYSTVWPEVTAYVSAVKEVGGGAGGGEK